MWVKLCGVRTLANARELVALRPDAIGLNFYQNSPRHLTVEAAAEITAMLPRDIAAVGVFVNTSLADLLGTVAAVGLTAVQLHGDEPPERVAALKHYRPDLMLIRAWRVAADDLRDLNAYLAACRQLGALPDAVLADAKVTGSYGGTGQVAPWALLRDRPADWPPLILAGGLVPENVAAAIATVRPWGVDTAGGVESSPGLKDAARAAAFLKAARG